LKSKMKHNKQVISDWHSFYQWTLVCFVCIVVVCVSFVCM
jgi:hypothetical protein